MHGKLHSFQTLQQHLPFTVLKLCRQLSCLANFQVATALTVYGIETNVTQRMGQLSFRCNSTYRLRY